MSKFGNSNIDKLYFSAEEVDRVYLGTNIIYDSDSRTILNVESGVYSLNIYKEDNKLTQIYVNNILVATSSTIGTQDIPISTSSTSVIKIVNEGNWYFDSYCLGSSENNDKLNNIDFTYENHMIKIGDVAFYLCTKLTNITIPDSVTIIEQGAFSRCSSLRNVMIPNNVTDIWGNAFYGCISLTSLIIGNSVTWIGNGAFYNCSGLTSITIPDSVTSIESFALHIGNESNKATISLLGNIPPQIRSDTFSTTMLEKIIIPTGTMSIYSSAENWNNLTAYLQEA